VLVLREFEYPIFLPSFEMTANIKDFVLAHYAFVMWDGGDTWVMTWNDDDDIPHTVMYFADDEVPKPRGYDQLPRQFAAQFFEQIIEPLRAAETRAGHKYVRPAKPHCCRDFVTSSTTVAYKCKSCQHNWWMHPADAACWSTTGCCPKCCKELP
jgi:hypothetical protein